MTGRWLLAGIALLHLPPLTLLVTVTRTQDWIVFGASYLLTVLVLGGGLHRYFSHRAFRTSRPLQLALGVLAGAFFGDAISFAGRHRLHHKHSDTDADIHSPRGGLWHCWLGHVLDHKYSEDQVLRMVPDLTRYPELVWLHRYWLVPGLATGLIVFLVGGYSMFAAGFCLSTVSALHATSAVNYFCHRGTNRRFQTGEDSTNNALLGILVLGEGWHNNHHRCPAAARAGFLWYELDPIYYLLRLLAWLGIVWDLGQVAEEVRRGR